LRPAGYAGSAEFQYNPGWPGRECARHAARALFSRGGGTLPDAQRAVQGTPRSASAISPMPANRPDPGCRRPQFGSEPKKTAPGSAPRKEGSRAEMKDYPLRSVK
jgi:hypothetical protein